MTRVWNYRPRWRTVAFPAAALCWLTLMYAYRADTGARQAADLVSATVRASHAGVGSGRRGRDFEPTVRALLALDQGNARVETVSVVDTHGHVLETAGSHGADQRHLGELTTRDGATGLRFRVGLDSARLGGDAARPGGIPALAAILFAVLALIATLAGSVRPLRRNRRRAKRDHHRDSLTGLLNRAGFEEAAHALLKTQRQTALLLLDLDRFKQVNDTLGHANGDSLLRQLGGRLNATCREADVLARLGGDEFAIALANGEGAAGATPGPERNAAGPDEAGRGGGAVPPAGGGISH